MECACTEAIYGYKRYNTEFEFSVVRHMECALEVYSIIGIMDPGINGWVLWFSSGTSDMCLLLEACFV